MRGFVAVAVITYMTALGGPTAQAASEQAAVSDIRSSAPVVEKRETCWRTNRSTGQRFRIC
jgi:hypothetical protein